MIISMLNGGLGNQFFQYATGKLIAKKNNVEFKIDPSYLNAFRFKRTWDRRPEILEFNLKHDVASRREVLRYRIPTGISYLDMFFVRLSVNNKKIYRLSDEPLASFLKFKELYFYSFVPGDYFMDIKQELREEFSMRNNHKINKISDNSVSIHVRRGDILKLRDAYILSIDYYKKAVDYLNEAVNEDFQFYVFSDDIKWCKENFDWLQNKEFIEDNSVAEDFELMKCCKYNILANSTLSWWVGYFNNPERVVAPRHFSFSKSFVQKELLVNEWHYIS